MLQTSSTIRSSKNLLLSIDVVESDEIGNGSGGDCKNRMVKKSLRSKNLNRATVYLTPDIRQSFTQLRQLFTEIPILQHFDLECYIRIKINALSYVIGSVFSQLIDSRQWHPVAYYSQKMILAKTCYKTYDGELLAIFETFKT